MGHFVAVYAVQHGDLDRTVGSGNLALAQAVVQRFPDDPPEPELIPALHHLLTGAYKPGLQPDGYLYVYAFEFLCRFYAVASATVQVNVHEQLFPEMFEFVWTAEYDPFGLPLCEQQFPVCSCWNSDDIGRLIELFESHDLQVITPSAGRSFRAEVATVLEVLRAARDQGALVFVFLSE